MPDRLEERSFHLGDHVLAREDVPLHRVPGPDTVARPGEAAVSGMRRGSPVGGDDAELARLASLVVGEDGTRSASSGVAPPASSASPRGPNAATPAAWVATAPTPACAQGTTVPTAKYLDCTAQPTSPDTGSAAQMENVDLMDARRTCRH